MRPMSPFTVQNNPGRGRSEVFDASLRRELHARAELQTSLGAAMAAEALVLHYQPIVQVPSEELQGYEALVRWVSTRHRHGSTGRFHPDG